MWIHAKIEKHELFGLIKSKSINFAGNKKLKIYGTLNCKSGKRMKRKNRVLFANEQEAASLGYRPCGHCMRGLFLTWKQASIS
jgi:methylphosphotriester-DNA--protein-cysteine methyltransferase